MSFPSVILLYSTEDVKCVQCIQLILKPIFQVFNHKTTILVPRDNLKESHYNTKTIYKTLTVGTTIIFILLAIHPPIYQLVSRLHNGGNVALVEIFLEDFFVFPRPIDSGKIQRPVEVWQEVR